MNGAHNTIYGSTRSLPPHSFIEVDDGIAISCPELIFLEMVDVMPLMRLVMLGHELCGTFSRDPHDPRNGEATLSCPPLTSCERIEAFIRETKWNAHAEQALRALSLVSDNAWSPTESIVAAVASLPYEEWGYGFGRCILNKRIDTSTGLALATGKDSRRPDILFEGTPVGLNYDGAIHLDLDAVAKAAMELERNPGEAANQQAFDAIVHEVRSRAVDDIRRNRELASAGYIVFPVTKEDLYEEGALDTVMLQVMKTIENLTGKDPYRTEYESDLIGPLTLASDGEAIVGCWFGNDRYFGYGVDGEMEPKDDLPVFDQAREWLDRYFAGEAPDPRELPLSANATPFQLRVREAMLDIPYGATTTYGDIAKRIASETGKRSSARAVGGAVGHNPLCIIAPCHRVVGADGSLTGFGGGIDMKVKLLEHEGAMKDSFTLPKKGTALEGDRKAPLGGTSAEGRLA